MKTGFRLIITLMLVSCNGVPTPPKTTLEEIKADGGINPTSPMIDNSIFPTCTSITVSAPSAITNDIKFHFDKPYYCGKFANGDWWVSPENQTGSVRLVSITPDGVIGKHGFEINPSNTSTQAFDHEADAGYNAALLPTLPRNFSGGTSIVKAVSIIPHPASRPAIQFAAVLTILNAPLANSETFFRPPYVGTNKPLFEVSSIAWNLLPKLPNNAIANTPSFQNILDRFKGVRLDHIGSWTGRDIHPKDSMPDYGAQIASDNAAYLLRLSSNDFDLNNNVHKQAMINYLQMAIDLYGMAMNGTKWNATGGHSIGRKLPLAFAAKFLGDIRFKEAILNSSFDEDRLIYRSSVNNKVLYGQAQGDTNYWQTTLTAGARGARDVRDPYQLIDGGGYEIGQGYQYCCTALPWKYTVLAVYLFNLEEEFNNQNLLEYVERWVGWGVIAASDSCAPYDGIPTNYGITFGPDSNNTGNCITGTGRWTARDGTSKNSGSYGNPYGNNMWTWYKAQANAKSTPYIH